MRSIEEPMISKHFLQPQFKDYNVSPKRFWLGIGIGVLSILAMYAVLVVGLASFRIGYAGADLMNLRFYSEVELRWTNFFIALLAIIYGQSKCFEIWLFKPKRPFEQKKSRHARKLLHNQRYSIWVYLSWITRIVMAVAIFSHSGCKIIELNKTNLTILCLSYLFLFWTSFHPFIQLFKRNGLKTLLLLCCMQLLVGLGLSQWNVYDFKSLNSILINNLPALKYDITLPNAVNSDKIYKQSLIANSYIGLQDSLVFLIDVNEKVESVDELVDFLSYSRKEHFSEDSRRKIIYRLHIDEHVPMRVVNELHFKLSQNEMFKIAYVVQSEFEDDYCLAKVDLLIRLPFYKDYMIDESTFPPLHPFLNFSEIYSHLLEEKFVKLELDESKSSLILNDSTISKGELYNFLKKEFETSERCNLVYYSKPEDVFGDYILILDTYITILKEKRNRLSEQTYQMSYDDLEIEQQREVRKQIPFRFTNATPYLMSKYYESLKVGNISQNSK